MKNIFLIDLRKKEEFKKFHIRGAKNIFWLDLLTPVKIYTFSVNLKVTVTVR